MKPVIYQLDWPLCLVDLENVKEGMSLEERKRLDKRLEILKLFFGLTDSKDRALAEKTFTLGYLAAHTYTETELPKYQE